jgi:hypothetical protein
LLFDWGKELGSNIDAWIILSTEHSLMSCPESIVSFLHLSYSLASLHFGHHTLAVSAHPSHYLSVTVPSSVVVSLVLLNVKAFLVVQPHILNEIVNLGKFGFPL